MATAQLPTAALDLSLTLSHMTRVMMNQVGAPAKTGPFGQLTRPRLRRGA
jgi:hypothetical protein